MVKSYPFWSLGKRVGNFPYIDGFVNTDVVFFSIQNITKTRTHYIYISTKEAKELIEKLKDAIDHNERVKGIRYQEFTHRWI